VKPVSAPVFQDSFSLTGIDASANHSKDGKPKSLGDIVKDVQTKFKVKVELFSQRTSNQTTFTVSGTSDGAVEAAKKALTTSLSPVVSTIISESFLLTDVQVSITVQTPASVVGSIVGPKGKQFLQGPSNPMTEPSYQALISRGFVNKRRPGSTFPVARILLFQEPMAMIHLVRLALLPLTLRMKQKT
jgi:hypothetical protein